jgi:hypothetical protein
MRQLLALIAAAVSVSAAAPAIASALYAHKGSAHSAHLDPPGLSTFFGSTAELTTTPNALEAPATWTGCPASPNISSFLHGTTSGAYPSLALGGSFPGGWRPGSTTSDLFHESLIDIGWHDGQVVWIKGRVELLSPSGQIVGLDFVAPNSLCPAPLALASTPIGVAYRMSGGFSIPIFDATTGGYQDHYENGDAKTVDVAISGSNPYTITVFVEAPAVAPAPVCPDYYVIDSRGSGEPALTVSPPGAVFISVFKSLMSGKTVAVRTNPYPARGGFSILLGAKLQVPGAYFNSATLGKAWLADEISKLRLQCKQAKVILTGYSQGAQVTADVIQKNLSLPNVAAAVIFGDPYFNGRDSRVDRGNPRYRTGVNGGLGTRPKFFFTHMLSYCHANDPVCQNTANPIALFTWHNNYNKLGEPAEAARVIAQWVK